MRKIYLFLVLLLVLFHFANAQSNITWTMGMNISANTSGNMHPRTALDRGGNPMVVWGRMSDASVMFSRWDGTMFTMPVKLNPPWMTVALAGWMGPDIAAFGDTVYVVVKRTPEVSDTNRIFIFTSFNGGVSFNPPVELGFIADSLSRFPTVTTDDIGNPLVAFMKFNASFLDSRWVVTKSADYGNSFATDVKASGWGGSAEVCDCCPGALVTSGSVSAMLYRDNNNNIRDIWTGISTNYASDFTSGIEVDNNNWMVVSCPSSGPDGTIIGDTLYSTFMSAGNGGGYRNYISKSSISSGAVNGVVNLTGSIPGLSQQNYPRIANDGKAAAIVWKQNVNGVAQLPVSFTSNIENGFPAAYDTVDLSDITNADVQLNNGNIWVVWQDDNSGTVKYRKGNYQVSTAVYELKDKGFALYPNPATSTISLEESIVSNSNEIKIFNVLGVLVNKQKYIFNSTIDVSNLENGIYSIHIQSRNDFSVQKFIKK